MKHLFKVNFDGTYTSIEKVEFEDSKTAKANLEHFPQDYYKTFAAAKREALQHMTCILKDWQYAVAAMRKQTKENW